MLISLSAVDQKPTQTFIKLLLTLFKYYREGDLPENLVGKVNEWVVESVPFLNKFKIPKREILVLFNSLRKGNRTKNKQLIEDFAVKVKELKKDISADISIKKSNISLINDFQLAVLKKSEPAINRISKNVLLLEDPDLTKHYLVEQTIDQKSIVPNLKRIVKSFTGKPEIFMTITESEAARISNPEKYKEYLKLKRQLTEAYKTALSNIVRSSGQLYIPVPVAKKELAKKGIVHQFIPENFVGNVDATGDLYTTAGLKIDGKPGGAVQMNPKYNPKMDNAYVFKATVPGGSTVNKYYTFNYKQHKKSDYFVRIEKQAHEINHIRKKWVGDLTKDGTLEQILATILEICYLTSPRVGSKYGETKGERTYGISTLEIRHIRLLKTEIDISYVGKAGKPQRHTIPVENNVIKKILMILVKLRKGKKPEDLLFEFSNKPITGTMINDYMRSLGMIITVHGFRKLRGTKLAQQLLENHPWKKKKPFSEKEVNDWFKEQITKIGAALGHFSGEKVTPNTAIKYYISPLIMESFYKEVGVRPSSAVQKSIDMLKKSGGKEED